MDDNEPITLTPLEIVQSGEASDEEIAQFLGPDLMNELAARWRDPEDTKRLFALWYADVMGPLGIEKRAAYRLFTGRTTIEEFAQNLTDATLDRFLESFESLQEAHQRKIDTGVVR